MFSTVVLIFFWQALIWTYNDNVITFHTVDPIIYSILFFFKWKSPGLASLPDFEYGLSRKSPGLASLPDFEYGLSRKIFLKFAGRLLKTTAISAVTVAEQKIVLIWLLTQLYF